MKDRKKEYNWEFIFLGANIDAISTAKKVGINENRAANYHADGVGTALNYDVIGETISNFRANESIDDDWKERIEDDYIKRKDR